MASFRFEKSGKIRTNNIAFPADRILRQDASFRVLPPGALAAGAFRANAAGLAVDGSDRIIDETDAGRLRHDVGGRGGSDSFRFARLDARPAIDAGDVLVIRPALAKAAGRA